MRGRLQRVEKLPRYPLSLQIGHQIGRFWDVSGPNRGRYQLYADFFNKLANSEKFVKKVPEITHLGEAPASSPLLWFSETRDVPSGTPKRMGKEPQAP